MEKHSLRLQKNRKLFLPIPIFLIFFGKPKQGERDKTEKIHKFIEHSL